MSIRHWYRLRLDGFVEVRIWGGFHLEDRIAQEAKRVELEEREG